ncbi:MAG: hypothetical protein R6V62_03340 [Candidatus Fermentibacteraceae bacterium]
MLTLLLPFLADTVVVPVDETLIRVHEWGVVTFTSFGTEAAGAPGDTYGFDPFGMVCVDAPVVWFHGSPFSGTFTARAGMGFVSVAYPEPSQGFEGATPQAVSWRIEGRNPVPFDEAPTPRVPDNTPFLWAMDHWRDVPCLDLYDGAGNYLDRFLYYETLIPDGIQARMNTVVEDGRHLAGLFSPEGLLITTGEGSEVHVYTIIPLPVLTDALRLPLESTDVHEKLCDWAGGNLKSQEIAALWNTWEPFFRERPSGERWLLFPLPPETVESISSINLSFENRYDIATVEYHRLFLGLVRLE